MFSANQTQVIKKLTAPQSSVDFLLCALPGETEFTLYASYAEDTFATKDPRYAFSGTFLGEIVSFAQKTIHSTSLSDISTPLDSYRIGVSHIINELQANGGKTVYSRVIVGDTSLSVSEIAVRYFKLLPDTFRFIFRRGDEIWIGASPELLLDNNRITDTLKTAALAGTRPIENSGEPWDPKNISEHQIVVDFLVETLEAHKCSPNRLPILTQRFGVVEHLLTPIEAIATENPLDLLAEMSPTPALLGWPRKMASDHIRSWEAHERGYYGGFIAIEHEPGHTMAFVNLRSVRLNIQTDGKCRYNIFVGGGLTAESNVDLEWEETVRKSQLLRECLLS